MSASLQDLNAMFDVYPEIYSGEFLSRMSQLKDDIESTARTGANSGHR